MKQQLDTMLTKIRLKFLWTIKLELFLALLAGVLFVKGVDLLRAVDSTAGVLDVGFIHFLLLAPAVVIGGLLTFWVVLNVGFTDLDRWFDGDEEKDVKVKSEDKRSLERDLRQASSAVRLGFFGLLFAVVMVLYGIGIVAFT